MGQWLEDISTYGICCCTLGAVVLLIKVYNKKKHGAFKCFYGASSPS